jgi:hypothetical protein
MKPVRQIAKDECVRACVASLLELALEEVPKFDPVEWMHDLGYWLKARGWGLVSVAFPEDLPEHLPAGYTLGAIPTTRDWPEGWMHCVVCLDGKVVWDPVLGTLSNGQRAKQYDFLYPLDPALATMTKEEG